MDQNTETKLKSHGLKCTITRKRVLNALVKADRPVSHKDLMKRLPKGVTDRTSVYRTLHRFVKAGLVHRVYTGRRQWLFEVSDNCKTDRCHLHFSCQICTKITCMDIYIPCAELPSGFTAKRQKVHIDGICADCGKKKVKDRKTAERSKKWKMKKKR